MLLEIPFAGPETFYWSCECPPNFPPEQTRKYTNVAHPLWRGAEWSLNERYPGGAASEAARCEPPFGAPPKGPPSGDDADAGGRPPGEPGGGGWPLGEGGGGGGTSGGGRGGGPGGKGGEAGGNCSGSARYNVAGSV